MLKGSHHKTLEAKQNRNDPGRFFGDGVTFKAKLIGILEVGEARGDRMCQEALQDLKMAIRAAGEHKQRITIHVTIEGLRLRDEKTGDSLYHHPVHKISFIAQDMTDSRAFGYIFGSPDTGHRFFGIKTDKAASQVVLAMRDLFQVVFELKKKEIELARQQIQSKGVHDHQPMSLLISSGSKNATNDPTPNLLSSKTSDGAKAINKETNLMSPESVADLVDLEQELSSIQRGITQMERITPSEPTPTSKNFTDEDPFGDSFTNFPTYNLLPPPESTRSRHSKPAKPPETNMSTNIATEGTATNNLNTNCTQSPPSISNISLSSKTNPPPTNTSMTGTNKENSSENWLSELERVDMFKSDVGNSTKALETTAIKQNEEPSQSVQIPKSDLERTPSSLSTAITSTTTTTTTGVLTETTVLAHDTDPFSPTRKKSDPFQDGDIFSKLDPFEFEFGKGNILPDTKITNEQMRSTDSASPTVFNGPLQVNLPPENWLAGTSNNTSNQSNSSFNTTNSTYDTTYGSVQRVPRQSSESPNSATARNRPSVFKQNTVDVISSISTKKMPPLFGHKFTKRDSHSINMRRLQESDSLSENEAAPEPPPRPDSSGFSIEPPPLPPKKQFSDIIIRPRITSSSAIPPPTRYDYVQAKIKSSQLTSILDSNNSDAPPIPLPSRRVGRTDSSYPGPGRPRKPGSEDDDYLTPLQTNRAGEIPPIIAPPPQSNKTRPRRQDTGENKIYDTIQNPIKPSNSIKSVDIEPEAILPDITLSQLLTLGVEDLAKKLNVPASKLNTMTLVELTSYLSEFIENSKKKLQQQHQQDSKQSQNQKQKSNMLGSSPPIFKVNFDQNSDATFIAKFDDNFGDDSSFVANFSQFENMKPETFTTGFGGNESQQLQTFTPKSVPPADRYAVFREIIDQELKHDSSTEIKSSPEDEDEEFYDEDEENSSPIQQQKLDNEYSDDEKNQTGPVPQSLPARIIDNKITEAISHAKDRYAALRDIILVENLFEKPKFLPQQQSDSIPTFQASFEDASSFESNIEMNQKGTIFQENSFPTNFDNPLQELHHQETIDENIIDESRNQEIETKAETQNVDQQPSLERPPSNDSSPDSNQHVEIGLSHEDSEINKSEDNITNLQKQNENNSSSIQTLNVNITNKDDLEIDELMNRAISNLSLDSRDHLSPKTPAMNKSPLSNDINESRTSPRQFQPQQQQTELRQGKSPISKLQQFNDVSTSPIPIQKSPQTVPSSLTVSENKNIEKSASQLTINSMAKSPSVKSPISRSPLTQSGITGNGILVTNKKITKDESNESWAVFDKPSPDNREITPVMSGTELIQTQRSGKPSAMKQQTTKDLIGESPCSSDGKDDWKNTCVNNRQQLPPETVSTNKRWPKGQTSSSSRDLSPWDDEAPNEYKKRPVGHAVPDRHGYYVRHARRMNSCDEDYEYEEEIAKRRERKIKTGISKSRDNFDIDSPGWYQTGAMHHSWSPQDEDERAFERGVYERSSYGGLIYDKRDHKHPIHSYDRRIAYDKRGKYYRDYSRPTEYDFDSYNECPDIKDRKIIYSRRDYENVYDDGVYSRGGMPPEGGTGSIPGRSSGSGGYKPREYFYTGQPGERRSFDRESIESYESGGRRRKSFGSGDVYGSFDSREEFRERYMSDKVRSIRKGMKIRGPSSLVSGHPDDYEPDSETDIQARRENREYSRSLQRPSSGTRIRKSSGSSPWDGEEPVSHSQKPYWKRPASASESDRRMVPENRRVLPHSNQSGGSDGEKERSSRFRKKQRQRGKDSCDIRPNLPTGRYPVGSSHRDNYDYVYDDFEQNISTQSPISGPPLDEDKFERLNRRRHDLNQRMMEIEQRKRGIGVPASSDKYYDDDDDDDDEDIEATKSAPIQKYSTNKKEVFYSEKDHRYSRTPKFTNERFDFDADFEDTPHSTSTGRSKFNFEDQTGFESDFITSPPTSSGPAPQQPPSAASTKTPVSAAKSSFRFSNDFSAKHSMSSNFGEGEFPTSNSTCSIQQITPLTTPAATGTSIQKLRFDDKVTISKFDHNQPSNRGSSIGGSSIGGVGSLSDAFDDDDFSKAQFDFENEDQWNADTPLKRNNNLRLSGKNRIISNNTGGSGSGNAMDKNNSQQENLRKSESVNIFARKSEDPFEDDDFFKSIDNSNNQPGVGGNGKNNGSCDAISGISNNENNNLGNGNGSNDSNKILNNFKKESTSNSSFQWDNDFAKFDENM